MTEISLQTIYHDVVYVTKKGHSTTMSNQFTPSTRVALSRPRVEMCIYIVTYKLYILGYDLLRVM